MKPVLLVMAALLMVGCKSTKPMYYYGGYQTTVYHYFKNDETTVDQQINALEIIIEKAANSGLPVAPGVHAHLGMLYFEQGDGVNGAAHFDAEKQLFPESAIYINFLLANQKAAK
ncbi:DUF4810 domain-containing protein [Alteromonas lipolytica]|uniref:DUF4810 domain-containing protein n=1 Tax=Alteromonas lipolytica TaxID=1856405 RepID=A0A1E8F919_9ALTE|nr:DUF4810 domain-containing protein [Alteromonas lipolytica]OFI32400.1 DUF4810 domain-containing protein [Alteromonas lipolytica]GGF79979.1 lipoprotein [Alteromonas lipolytica]